jgi:hypothetical protein
MAPTELVEHEATAQKQEERVIEIFRLNKFRSLNTREVHAIYMVIHDQLLPIERKTPHDSIKRAITNLTARKDGQEPHLVKNGKSEMVMGPYGVKVCTWKLNPNRYKPTQLKFELDLAS